MTITKHFVLAAGGTGGHMVPAHALAAELTARGHRVALITDARGAKIPGLFDGVQMHVLPAGRLTKVPTSWVPGARAILSNATAGLVGGRVVVAQGGRDAARDLRAAALQGQGDAAHLPAARPGIDAARALPAVGIVQPGIGHELQPLGHPSLPSSRYAGPAGSPSGSPLLPRYL